MVFVESQQVVVDDEFGVHVVAAALALCQIGHCHGVAHGALVFQVVGLAGDGQWHGVEAVGVIAVLVLLVDGHVRHAALCVAQQTLVVHVVLGVGEREVGAHADALRDVVVECHAGGEAVELLLDDGTRLVVVTSGDTERGFLTTTRYGDVVVLSQTPLCDGVAPVGVVVELLVLRERRLVVDFVDVGRLVVVLLRVEVGLLQHHGVVVAIEHGHSLGLIGAGESQLVRHAWFASHTALGGQLDDTVTTLRAVDGAGGGILQHGDAGDVLRVDVQQFGKFLVVGASHVEVVEVHLADVSVDDDERVGVGECRERAATAQTHGGACSQVARVADDVESGDTSLQCLVDGGQSQSFKLLHRDGLR